MEFRNWLGALVFPFAMASAAAPCRAAEGFHLLSQSAPSAVTDSWESVFLFFLDEPSTFSIGTAFLVRADVGPRDTDMYFLTNKHVLKGHCDAKGVCMEISLFQDGRFDTGSAGARFVSYREPMGLVSVITSSKNPDLAVLKVTRPNDKMRVPKVLRISKTCEMKIGEPLYGIGFPYTPDRQAKKMLPIEQQNLVIKRWSQGIYTGSLRTDERGDENTMYFYGSTVDALTGNSGGPILNARGEVVAVAKAGAGLAKNQFGYFGNETSGQLDWQSEGVPCEYLKAFAGLK